MRLLHLSDLHLGHPSQADEEAQRIEALFTRVETLAATQPFEVVLITGNLVHGPQADAFTAAEQFCAQLLSRLHLNTDQIYLTPGEREVDQTQVTVIDIKRWYPFNTQDELTEVLSDPEVMPQLMAKFKAFNAFAKTAMGREQYTATTYHLVDSPQLPSSDARINIMGLNACLLAGYEAAPLALSTLQCERAVRQLNAEAALSIGFFHHPFAAFHAADQINQTLLRRRLDLIFTGPDSTKMTPFMREVESKACVISASKQRFNCVDVDLQHGEGIVQSYVYAHQEATWGADECNPFVIEALRQAAPAKPCHTAPAALAPITDDDAGYDIFISYSQADLDWVKTHLLAKLQHCEGTDGRQLRIFHDLSSIPGGAPWRQTLAQGIQHCQHFLAVYSPAYFASRWCLWELGLAAIRDPNQQDGIVVPVHFETPDIPFEFRTMQALDATRADFYPRLYTALGVTSRRQAANADIQTYTANNANTTSTSTQVHWIHDYLLPLTFTGRLTERQRLSALLRGAADPETQKHATLITVRALGGMGKSCLMRKLVDDLQGDTRFHHIVWFSFYEARTEDESWLFHQLLQALEPSAVTPEHCLTGAEENRRLYACLRCFLDQTATLLVFDGLEVIQNTKDNADPAYGRIKPTHPQTSKLLAHLCNPTGSVGLVTSRVTLTDFSGVMGYLEMDLHVMQAAIGAEFLQRMGVKGSDAERAECGRLFGGHPLTLKAAGQYMQFKHIPAADVTRLTGNLDAFEGFAEGQKLRAILNAYRAELSQDQKTFLKMLSLHPRTVTEANFPVLVENYNASQAFQPERNRAWVLETIIDPLKRMGLIEVVKDAQGVGYNAHPLVKLTFLSWLGAVEQQQAHQRWARGIQASPDVPSSTKAVTNLAALQPFLDMVEHYLQARENQSAWEIYTGKDVDFKLLRLGGIERLAALGHAFENRFAQGEWPADTTALVLLYHYLAVATNEQGLDQISLEYRQKQLEAAEESDHADTTVSPGVLLAQKYLGLGDIKHAKQQLAQVASSVTSADDVAANLYAQTHAQLALYSGEYIAAITQYQHAPKPESIYNQVMFTCKLATAYRRDTQFDKATETLNHAADLLEQHHIPYLTRAILAERTDLALKQHQTDQARRYENQRQTRLQDQNLAFIPNGFLLVQEQRYDFAIQTMMPLITHENDVPVNKAREIEALLVLSQAWFGKGEVGKAQDHLQQAGALMTQTGCWVEKDRWEETQQLFI